MQSHLVALFKVSSALLSPYQEKTYLRVFTAALKFHDLKSVKGVVRNDWCSTHWSDGGVVPIFYNCQLSRTLSISTQQPDQATGSTGGLQQSKQQSCRIAAEQAAAAAEKAELQDCQLQRRPLLKKVGESADGEASRVFCLLCPCLHFNICTSISAHQYLLINICSSTSAYQYLLINICSSVSAHQYLLINICSLISAHSYMLINVCSVRVWKSVLLILSPLTSTRVLVGLIGTDVQTNVLNDRITHIFEPFIIRSRGG